MRASRAVLRSRVGFRLSHIGWILLAVCPVLQGCGSSTSTATSPSTISRCALTIQGIDGQIPAQGGSGSVTIAAARDCTWTASAEGQWLSLRSTNNGQGDGSIEFAASANPDP